MSRVEKFGRSRKKKQHDKAERQFGQRSDSTSNQALPPRRQKHPSSSQKIAKWYYNLLFVLFVCLVAGLFWYGVKYSQ
ncbi:hypothetical protein ACFSL6_16760 [Paenibacillus thailandensis]|uniref:Uncharacterized protein n=1 Tax=Paenibacillus thailandensis TaxID=393250 RepID=A0ABW5R097_9BACL